MIPVRGEGQLSTIIASPKTTTLVRVTSIREFLSIPLEARSQITANSVVAFYTIYLKPTVSLSISGGPQHFSVFQAPLPVYSSWQPTFTAGIGWQVHKANIVGSYSQIVSGGGGWLGPSNRTSATVTARWQFARNWSGGVALSYMINKNVTPAYLHIHRAGRAQHHRSYNGPAPTQRTFQLDLGYTRWQQKYSSLQVISSTPSTDRVFFTVTYQLRRPLGE